jgi:2-polyprenyl-6-methoxyphenol hydroxylase-like FAD-dependent oxidoreductase
VRAVVVGAGIGGLATAIALKQAGVEPILIERAPKLEEAGFGLVVSANAVTALRALGLRDAVAARGTRVRRAEIRTPRGELLTLIDYQALGWETYGILRAELQQAMLEVAPAECLRLGTLCTGATEDGQALLEDAHSVVADVVVGADGIRSAVRRSLFGEEPLRYGGHRAWRAGTRFENELVRDRFVEVWGVGGGFGFGPAGPGRVYWYCFETVPEGAPAPDRPRELRHSWTPAGVGQANEHVADLQVLNLVRVRVLERVTEGLVVSLQEVVAKLEPVKPGCEARLLWGVGHSSRGSCEDHPDQQHGQVRGGATHG